MAEGGADLSDLLNCSMCLEPFRDPRALPCLHTFCLPCLTQYQVGGIFDVQNLHLRLFAMGQIFQAGHAPGLICANHKVGSYLPGVRIQSG